MKKAILLSAMVLLAILSYGQDRIREIGLSFYNLNGFGLNYKTGTTTALWRLQSLYLNLNSEDRSGDNSEEKTRNAGVSFRAGREYRKSLSDNLEFRYGFDLSFSISSTKQESMDKINPGYDVIRREKIYAPGADAVIGVNYLVQQKLIIGAELTPGVYYRTGEETRKYYNAEQQIRDISAFGVQAGLSSVMLTVAYRF